MTIGFLESTVPVPATDATFEYYLAFTGRPALKIENNHIIALAAVAAVVVVAAVLGRSEKALSDYRPGNQEESEIVAFLMKYENTRRKFNLQGYLACLHDKGIYHHAGGVMVSKQKLAESLPGFWEGLRKGSREFFPMCRESLNGNWFVGFHIFSPIIELDGNEAKVTVTYSNAGWRIKHFIHLLKENNAWLITLLDWETR